MPAVTADLFGSESSKVFFRPRAGFYTDLIGRPYESAELINAISAHGEAKLCGQYVLIDFEPNQK